MENIMLALCVPGNIVLIDNYKYVVSDVISVCSLGYAYIYVYPYLPYNKENQSNIGENFKANLMVKKTKINKF